MAEIQKVIYRKRDSISADDLLSLTIAGDDAPDGGEKWKKLHDELKKQLDVFDRAAGL